MLRGGLRRYRLAAMRKLDGKVVVVTGASRGIGAEVARLFAAEGGRVICPCGRAIIRWPVHSRRRWRRSAPPPAGRSTGCP